MAGNLGTIYYTVEARTESLLSAERDVGRSLDSMTGDLNRTERAAGNLNTGMSKLAKAIGAVIAAGALRQMATMVQEYQEYAERVQMATSTTEEFEMVQKRLVQTANGTYRALSEAQELYIRTADALRSMGYETSEALDVQDSLSYSFVTNAATADRAQAAISAFSKSVNTGKVAADQFETILMAVPTVIDDIAAASGKTGAEVRALGAAGKLTARDLTEGLRKSLEANSAAASEMGNTLVDASVRTKNALTTVLVAMEDQSGALETLTNGIIMASDKLLEFGGDAEAIEKVLVAVQLAAVSTAAVIAGRMVAALTAGTASLYANTVAARAKAAADLTAAQTGSVMAAQNLIATQTSAQAAVGLSTHAAAARTLTLAQAQATAATATLSAAQRVMASTSSMATVAVGGLRTAMGFLGGPVGVALLAAGALYVFLSRAKEARQPTIDLATAVKDLTSAQRDLGALETARALEETSGKLASLSEDYSRMERLIDDGMVKPSKKLAEGQARARVEIEALNETLKTQRQRLQELRDFKPEDKPQGGGTDAPTTTADGQKALASMQLQLELTKLQGVARAKLAALQKLGAEATDEERAEAERLAAEIYNLEQAQTAAANATKEHSKASEDAATKMKENASSLMEFREQIYQVSLSAEELAARQAELSLNKYATPEQIAEVRQLAVELHNARTAAADLASRRAEFGKDPGDTIRGDVNPLSGGQFDDQSARYQAEADQEKERYADQMARLAEAKALELEVKGGYYSLEEQMAQEHADRMGQIEQAKTQLMLSSAEAGFGAVADTLKTAFGEQNGLYKAAFIAQKAFAVAQSIIAIQQGIALAAANPFPANIAAMGAVAAATAGLVSNITSVSMGAGKRYGGSVSAGSMHRINENGRPEIMEASNGSQYLLPNTRGKVVSNEDSMKSMRTQPSGGMTNVTQNITVSGKMDNHTARQLELDAARSQARAKARLG
jgi:tape measure domain-containing protein